MAHIKVHKFASVEDAKAAVEYINEGEGIPGKHPSSTATTYTDYVEDENGIYIIADEVTQKYFTEVEEIERNNDNNL